MVLVLLAAPVSGCGINPGSGLCTVAKLAAPPVTVTDKLAPLTLTATLTAGGKPVAGGDIVFFVTVQAPSGAAGLGNGSQLGHTLTGTDGVAHLIRRGGVDGLATGSDRLTSYGAEFTPLDKINGAQYCKARVESPLIVS